MTSLARFRRPLFIAGAAGAIGFALGGSQNVDLFGIAVPLPIAAAATVGAASAVTNGVVRPLLLERFQSSEIAGVEVALSEPVINTAIMYSLGFLAGDADILTAAVLGGGATLIGGYADAALLDY